MKTIKRTVIAIMLLALLLMVIPVSAAQVKIPLVNGSGYVKWADNSDFVYINTEYNIKNSDFRGVWVTPLVGDIAKYESKEQYKSEIISVLDTMKAYNLNAMIFHIRIMNDALYESKYNNWSVYYNENPDWEALPWVIEECHKRGIEFHAWMNPYRVRNGQNDLVSLAKEFPSNNMASDPNNLLQGSNSVILNPGIPKVKKWLVDVCMEVVQKYDVDAIHFDDYFYDYKVDDTTTRKLYNTEGLSLGDFRRKQVDDFIEDLSKNIRAYNEQTGKRVQLGISPSGVYRSGDGKVTYDENGNAITNGSLTTTSYIHYDDYLYSDTLKWINNEWIDYILPQCYWSIEHPMCPYADLLDWWNRVAKYKKVNVYSGIGLGDYGQEKKYSWISDTEAYHQIMLANGMENVNGVAFFSYKTYERALSNPKMLTNVDKIWKVRSLTPEIQYGEKIVPNKITGVEIYNNEKGYTMRWNNDSLDKFYVIYRSENNLKFDPSEVIDVVGVNLGKDGKQEYVDETAEKGKTYTYGIRSQSNSFTLGEGETITTEKAEETKKAYLGDIKYYFVDELSKGNKAMIAFDKLSYYKGTSIKYELSYSFDGNSETKVTNFLSREGSLYTYIDIPNDATTFNGTLKAYNDMAESEVILEKNITESLSKITNFGLLTDSYDDNFYNDELVNFVFNIHENEGLTYTLEYSKDGFEWNKYLDINQSLKNYRITVINCRFQSVLYDGTGKQYYRIKATDGNLSSYSDIVSIQVYSHLNKPRGMKVNSSSVKDIYYVNENDKMTFEWIPSKVNGTDVNEALMVSSDGVNWSVLRSYAKIKNSSTETLYQYEITIPGSEYEVQIKLILSINGLKYESESITIFVQKLFVFYDDLGAYINTKTSGYLKNTQLFN